MSPTAHEAFTTRPATASRTETVAMCPMTSSPFRNRTRGASASAFPFSPALP